MKAFVVRFPPFSVIIGLLLDKILVKTSIDIKTIKHMKKARVTTDIIVHDLWKK